MKVNAKKNNEVNYPTNEERSALKLLKKGAAVVSAAAMLVTPFTGCRDKEIVQLAGDVPYVSSADFESDGWPALAGDNQDVVELTGEVPYVSSADFESDDLPDSAEDTQDVVGDQE